MCHIPHFVKGGDVVGVEPTYQFNDENWNANELVPRQHSFLGAHGGPSKKQEPEALVG